MKSEFKFSAITGSLGKVVDRFVPSGYNDDISFEQKLEVLSKTKCIEGVELCYDGMGEESDEVKVKELLAKFGFKASCIIPLLSHDRKFKFGSYTSKDKTIRREAIDITKKTMDYAERLGCENVNLWLGEDGFDYPFQVDYGSQWDFMMEALRECADHNPKIKLALEPKPKEPRNFCSIDTVSTALLMSFDSKRDNVGVGIDAGHILQAGQNVAQTVELAAKFGKLFNMHINDNYGRWDDDLIVGSVRTLEFIELFFTLRKVDYNGFIAVDIFPFRENTLRACEESLLNMKKFNELVDVIDYKNLEDALKHDDITSTIRLVREKIYR